MKLFYAVRNQNALKGVEEHIGKGQESQTIHYVIKEGRGQGLLGRNNFLLLFSHFYKTFEFIDELSPNSSSAGLR